MPSAYRVAARHREAMFGLFSQPTPPMDAQAAASLRRYVRIPEPLYVPVDQMDLTWVYRQGVRQPKVWLYEDPRRAFGGGKRTRHKAVAVVSRQDLDPSKIQGDGAKIEFKGRIPREALYMLITDGGSNLLPPGTSGWKVPVLYAEREWERSGYRVKWKATKRILRRKRVQPDVPNAPGQGEAPADAPYGEYLFGELRRDVSETNTKAEEALISVLRRHFKGGGDPFRDPPLSGDAAKMLKGVHDKGWYSDWLQVPKKYRYAYRIMDNISFRGLTKMEEGASPEQREFSEDGETNMTSGATYKPRGRGQASSWTVDTEAIEKMVRDWRFQSGGYREYPDSDTHIAIAVADLSRVRNSFLLNPDRIAQIGLASDFTYQREVIGWGSFPIKLIHGELSNDQWRWDRELAEENEEQLRWHDDDDEELDIDGYESVDDYDSDHADEYEEARENLIERLVDAL
jgi:hypothetical protein